MDMAAQAVPRTPPSSWLLRIAVTAHMVAAFAQPVTAGIYLSGGFNGLGWHLDGANAATIAGAFQIVMAVVVAVRARRVWPLVGSLTLMAIEYVVYEAGKAGALWLHIPLSVVVIVGSTVMVLGVWLLPLSRRCRPFRTDGNLAAEQANDDG
ncbi:hypothetical protein [Plantactinospora mayteni]